jgi:hypothetical protein
MEPEAAEPALFVAGDGWQEINQHIPSASKPQNMARGMTTRIPNNLAIVDLESSPETMPPSVLSLSHGLVRQSSGL